MTMAPTTPGDKPPLGWWTTMTSDGLVGTTGPTVVVHGVVMGMRVVVQGVVVQMGATLVVVQEAHSGVVVEVVVDVITTGTYSVPCPGNRASIVGMEKM